MFLLYLDMLASDISRRGTHLVYEYLLLLRLYSSLTVGCEETKVCILKEKSKRQFLFLDIEH